jgi:hypothetical protein
MRNGSTGFDHQPGSLLPNSGAYFWRLPDIRTPFPAGPAFPPVRCPPSGIKSHMLIAGLWH